MIQPSQKLTIKCHRPFKIIEALSKDVYKLELPSTMACMHPVFNVTCLEPAHNNSLPGQCQDPPLLVEIEGEEEWEVEAILDSKWEGQGCSQQVKYLMH